MVDKIYEKLDKNLRSRLFVSVIPTVGSTNTQLKASAEQGAADGNVLIALEQTAGRGRLGRSFYSPKDTGLYMSILLRPQFSAEKSLKITACAAVAASEAIDRVAGVHTDIKWVNDIYLNNRKVCGILTEASINYENGGLNYAILGVGINLTTSDFPSELKNIAASVLDKAEDIRAFTAAEFMNSFFKYYDNLDSCDFISEYRSRSMLNNMDISFIRGNDTYSGRVLGIDDDLRLIVRLENGREAAFSSGEVQLKKGDLIK